MIKTKNISVDTVQMNADFRIFILEDHIPTAKLLASKLHTDLECPVILTHSLAQAELTIASHETPFSLAICDLNLSDGRHEEIIDAVKKHSIPIIALTGEYSETLRESILKKGVVDFILKDSPSAFQYASDLAKRIRRNIHTKVLLVDDSDSSRRLLTIYLAQQKLQVLIAHDSTEALKQLEKHPDIRLMMTDFEMPGLNGVELVSEVRKKRSKEELAIIGISGSSDGKLSARFLKSGANDFIRKPFVYEEILCRTNQNLEMLELIDVNRHAATRDFLTGLYNRRYFYTQGEKQLKAAFKHTYAVAMAIIDIDHFKHVNDTYGHDWGDIALKKTAENIAKFFKENLACRLGGEEFTVLFINKSTEQVHQLLEQFRCYQQEHPVKYHDNSDIYVRVSIGLVSHHTTTINTSLDELSKVADVNLYSAKQGGRNRIVSST